MERNKESNKVEVGAAPFALGAAVLSITHTHARPPPPWAGAPRHRLYGITTARPHGFRRFSTFAFGNRGVRAALVSPHGSPAHGVGVGATSFGLRVVVL